MNKRKKTIISFFILIVVIIIFIYTTTSFLSSINRLKSDVSSYSSEDDLTFKVGTFNIGGWKCGNKTGGITCPDSSNDKISVFLNNLNLDLVGIQEGAVFDDNDNTLPTNINELASLTNFNLKYVAPKQINALLSKYTMKDLSEEEYNIPLTDCAYSHNNYMEKRALLKEIVNINGIDI